MFWAWLLKYSSFFITGAVSLLVGILLHKITVRRSSLVYYNSHPQWVTLPPQQQGAHPPPQPLQPIGTFTLFLWNQGRATAKEVHVGHY